MNSPCGSLQSYLNSSTQTSWVPGISNHGYDKITANSKSENWHLPRVLCVHFMKKWAQALFLSDSLENAESSGSMSHSPF